jgi:hypothetical protein
MIPVVQSLEIPFVIEPKFDIITIHIKYGAIIVNLFLPKIDIAVENSAVEVMPIQIIDIKSIEATEFIRYLQKYSNSFLKTVLNNMAKRF